MPTEILFPPSVQVQDEGITIVDDMTQEFQSAFARGQSQVQVYGGPRIAMTRRITVRQTELGKMLAWLQNIRGKGRMFYASPNYQSRGALVDPEMLTNNVFFNGTTGWTTYDSLRAESLVIERIMRVRRLYGGQHSGVYQTPTIVQGVPYVARVFVYPGAASGTPIYSLQLAEQVVNVKTIAGDANGGYTQAAIVPNNSTTVRALVYESATSGSLPGDYYDVPFMSLCRCFLVDNGGNLLSRSDEFNTTWTTSQATISANAVVAPDGTATADNLVDNGTSNPHYVTQGITVASAAVDFSFSVYVKAQAKSFAFLQLTVTSSCYVIFDLSGAGAVGTPTNAASWTNTRGHIVNVGNGWYRITISSTKTGSDTAMSVSVGSATSISNTVYAGASNAAITVWRASMNYSSVPCRGAPTTTGAVNTAGQTGNGLYLKGLPPSVNGLLLEGDMVEIGRGQLAILTATLNSDAAGMGHMQFGPALVTSPADSDPVIANYPLGKFIQKSDPQITNRFGLYGEISIEMEQRY